MEIEAGIFGAAIGVLIGLAVSVIAVTENELVVRGTGDTTMTRVMTEDQCREVKFVLERVFHGAHQSLTIQCDHNPQ